MASYKFKTAKPTLNTNPAIKLPNTVWERSSWAVPPWAQPSWDCLSGSESCLKKAGKLVIVAIVAVAALFKGFSQNFQPQP